MSGVLSLFQISGEVALSFTMDRRKFSSLEICGVAKCSENLHVLCTLRKKCSPSVAMEYYMGFWLYDLSLSMQAASAQCNGTQTQNVPCCSRKGKIQTKSLLTSMRRFSLRLSQNRLTPGTHMLEHSHFSTTTQLFPQKLAYVIRCFSLLVRPRKPEHTPV